ncbi:MAG: phosphoethanolamine--lipid A transferase [Myxococcales bacterium]
MNARSLGAHLPLPLRGGWETLRGWRPQVTIEALAFGASAFFVLCCNLKFWHAALPLGLAQWKLAISLFLLLVGVNGFLLGLVLGRRWARPLLSALFVVTACAVHYMDAYGVYLDPDMLRNVLNTDWGEAHELFTPALFRTLFLCAVLPIAVLWRIKLVRRSKPQAMLVRGGFLLLMWLLIALGAALSMKDLFAMARNQRELRYLVTPENYVFSLAKVLHAQPPGARKDLLPIAEDATQAPRAAGAKPRLLVLVVGETARAQNWGLNGYARQTTPELAGMNDVINFPDMQSCGTATEVSVPCMFSPWGRHDYNEKRIRAHQSFLHVLQRVGVEVSWRDNQSGCKGVCDGLPFVSLTNEKDPRFCSGERCLDEILLQGLTDGLPADGKDRIVVLHMLGNHGPSYFDRYPPQFKHFVPACENPELGQCTNGEIVNAYDNALLYTDHVLAETIDKLRGVGAYDTALFFMSDHGESLGENGIYLHGMPYAIAPPQQTHVPMILWFSPQFARDAKLDVSCVRRETAQPASHDNLFPSVLGLFDVRTKVYDKSRDLLAACRGSV